MIADQSNHANGDVQAVTSSGIEVQWYFDVYSDVEGWFAFGHHHPQAFIAAIATKMQHPLLTPDRVKQVWAKLSEHTFEISPEPEPETQPVTLIELDDVDSVLTPPQQAKNRTR